MDDKTTEFLAACKKYGITRVAIGVRHKLVPMSVEWPFGIWGSVFQHPKDAEYDGRPAIWRICEDVGVGNGCGNTAQHNYVDGTLIPGVYVLEDDEWEMVI